MLDLRPNCECCDRDLPADSREARICTFECTFCAACAETTLRGICPNCGGDLVARPIRPVAMLAKYPASTKRILKAEGSLETEDMLLELEMAMEDELRERDRQPTPTGEVRWHQSARTARKEMIDAGLMAGGKPGVWELTEAGRAVAY